MNFNERKKDVLRILADLDISPSMYSNATEKYNNIAKYLQEHGIVADMYPQGSFALGTICRPYRKDKDPKYDLDFICQIVGDKDSYTPQKLKKEIEDVLDCSELYGGKVTIFPEGFTIEYADIGGIGFSIDIVPAIDESDENKVDLKKICDSPELIDTAIAIPKFSESESGRWITNNPKGYRTWFEDINSPFATYSSEEHMKELFERNKTIYNTIEDVPAELNRTSLQRVIQLLKYHRDVYFSRKQDGEAVRPNSSIITTLVTLIAKNLNPRLSIFDLLEAVLTELEIYAKYQKFGQAAFNEIYGLPKVELKSVDDWKLLNPANPGDNLMDAWNSNSELPKNFFMWVKAAKSQLIDALYLDDYEFRSNIENAFEPSNVSRIWGEKYSRSVSKPIDVQKAAKPWS